MAAHTEEQRVFIVRRLAVFDSAPAICAAFTLRWPETACTTEDVAANDPSRDLRDEKLLAIFNARRAEFMASASAPTADKQVRLIELQRLFEYLRDRNALELALKTLEQIAKEQAGFYASKAGAVPPPASERVAEIRRTIVDPAAEPAA